MIQRARVAVPSLLVVLALGAVLQSQAPNTLSAAEKQQGWVLLFNGRTFDGWRQCNGTAMPANWVVEDQAMKVFTAPGRKPGQGAGGDIVYGLRKFRDFELSIDWKTEKAGNSGVFFNVREVPGQPIYYAAPEVQILDNVDATDNKEVSHLAGSLYDMLPAASNSVKPCRRVEHDCHSREGRQGHAHAERHEGRRVHALDPRVGCPGPGQQVQDVQGLHRGHCEGGLHRPPGPRLRDLVPKHQDPGAVESSRSWGSAVLFSRLAGHGAGHA